MLIPWRLLYFNFDAADPVCDKIVDGGADNAEDEPHHAVDHRNEKTIPNMIPATTAPGAVEEAWAPCACCANAPAAAASIKIGRKIKPMQA